METNSECIESSESYPDKKEWVGEKPDYAVINHIVNKHGDYLLTLGIQKTAYIHKAIESALINMQEKLDKAGIR